MPLASITLWPEVAPDSAVSDKGRLMSRIISAFCRRMAASSRARPSLRVRWAVIER